MENMKSEFYKQIVLSVVRHVLTGLAAALIAKGFISQDQADFLIVEVAGAVFGGISLVWLWLKTKNGVKLVQAALNAEPGTPLAQVKERAKRYE